LVRRIFCFSRAQLADDAFTQGQMLAHGVLPLVGIAGQQTQLGMLLGGIQNIEGRVLRRDHRRQLGQNQAAPP